MEQEANIHCRVPLKLKKRANKVLHHLSLNMTDAVCIFLTQVVLHKGLPFSVKVPNQETIEAMEEARDSSKLSKARSVKELFERLRK